MIKARTSISKPPAVRTIYDIMRHPRTDAEEHRADEHIRQEAERIQATWSETERETRRAIQNESWRPMVLTELGQD